MIRFDVWPLCGQFAHFESLRCHIEIILSEVDAFGDQLSVESVVWILQNIAWMSVVWVGMSDSNVVRFARESYTQRRLY